MWFVSFFGSAKKKMNITLLFTLKVSFLEAFGYAFFSRFSDHAPYFFPRKKSKQKSSPGG
jgi:hypothetical protein